MEQLHFKDVVTLSNVGDKTSEKLSKINVRSVFDVLYYFPCNYRNFTKTTLIRQVKNKEFTVIEAQVVSVRENISKNNKNILNVRALDQTGYINIAFFHAKSFIFKKINLGQKLFFLGQVFVEGDLVSMVNPIIQNINSPLKIYLDPIYRTTSLLSQSLWLKITDEAIKNLNLLKIDEVLPLSIIEKYQLLNIQDSITLLHRAKEQDINLILLRKHPAVVRVVLEELLAFQVNMLHLKQKRSNKKSISFKKGSPLIQKFKENLSFTLTSAQNKVIREIFDDLSLDKPMFRLVQGDVGSGKTVIAALSSLKIITEGYQVALMAPTELLAQQHFNTFKNWFDLLGIDVVFLGGALSVKQRKEILNSIENGDVKMIIGTHALIQKQVVYNNLALSIVDEQHRFGVNQRFNLSKKNNAPIHQLLMTATPIPRTLAMSLYSYLDTSIIDKLPPDRQKIITKVYSNLKREDTIERLKDQLKNGIQVYWVCTLIEESEHNETLSAIKIYQELKMKFSGIQIGLVHSKLSALEKEKQMKDFSLNKIQLLVSTTVIEVGVDVPNATIMIIENAEKLGLAQLHQLRGRIGRGSKQSFCILMYQNPLSQIAKKRLAVIGQTQDGFLIAEKDLEMRGEGEILGMKQSGEVEFRFANLQTDVKFIEDILNLLPLLSEENKNNLTKRYFPNLNLSLET